MSDELYEFKEEPKKPTRPRAASAAAPASDGVAPSLPYAAKGDGTADLETRVRDFHAPLYLLAGGIVVEFGASWLLSRGRAPDEVLLRVGIEMVVWTILLLVGVLLGARLKGLALGPFWTAVWKLTALSVAPSAVQSALLLPLQFVPLGWLVAWAVGFLTYFALLSFLFDLDQEDTWFLVVVIFGVQLAFVAALIWLV
jgi:hypothetical protein